MIRLERAVEWPPPPPPDKVVNELPTTDEGKPKPATERNQDTDSESKTN